MSHTFLILDDDSPAKPRSFGKHSEIFDDFLTPLQLAQNWKQQAYCNYQRHKSLHEKDIIQQPVVKARPYADFYQQQYKTIPQKAVPSNDQYIEKCLKDYWSRNIVPNNNKRNSKILNSPKLQELPTEKVQRFTSPMVTKKPMIIKGKTYYLESTYNQTLESFRAKMKSSSVTRPRTEGRQIRKYSLAIDQSQIKSRYNQTSQTNRMLHRSVHNKPNISNIISNCDQYLAKQEQYDKYDLDYNNKSLKEYFMMHDTEPNCTEMNPYKILKIDIQNNDFIQQQNLRILKRRQERRINKHRRVQIIDGNQQNEH